MKMIFTKLMDDNQGSFYIQTDSGISVFHFLAPVEDKAKLKIILQKYLSEEISKEKASIKLLSEINPVIASLDYT